MIGVHWETSFGALLDRVLPRDEDVQHLVISADGPLALLPVHLSILGDGRLLADKYRISYAPSLAHFAPAASREPSGGLPRTCVVLNSRSRLQGPLWELAQFKARFGQNSLEVLDGVEGGRDEVQSRLGDCDIIHVATHGHTFTDTPDKSGLELAMGNILSIQAIETLTLKPGSLVFLNACGSNRVTIRSRIQFSSIANAFLAAGASTVVATFWETDDVAAALISDRFYTHLLDERRGPLESFNLALDWLRKLNLDELDETRLGALSLFLPVERKQPYSHSALWGQFALFGRW